MRPVLRFRDELACALIASIQHSWAGRRETMDSGCPEAGPRSRRISVKIGALLADPRWRDEVGLAGRESETLDRSPGRRAPSPGGPGATPTHLPRKHRG